MGLGWLSAPAWLHGWNVFMSLVIPVRDSLGETGVTQRRSHLWGVGGGGLVNGSSYLPCVHCGCSPKDKELRCLALERWVWRAGGKLGVAEPWWVHAALCLGWVRKAPEVREGGGRVSGTLYLQSFQIAGLVPPKENNFFFPLLQEILRNRRKQSHRKQQK